MYLESEKPRELLVRAGYEMIGESNQYRMFTTPLHLDITQRPARKERKRWFHAHIQPDEKGVKLHLDIAKTSVEKMIFKQHYSLHRSSEVKEEINRIKELDKY